MYISVIIPAYNESKRITPTLKDVGRYLSKQDYDYEIIVVSDGSKDDTADVVNSLIPEIRNLKIIDNKKNHGKGWVVRQGMMAARGNIRVFMDADNSTSIDHLEKMIPIFKDNYDVVIGSRRIKGAKIDVHQPWYKEILGRMGNLWIRVFAVSGISDTQAGFKGFTAKATEEIFPRMTLEKWGFDFEVLAIARKLKFKIKEMPIEWINDAMSHVKMSAYVKTLVEALEVRLNLFSGRYNKKHYLAENKKTA